MKVAEISSSPLRRQKGQQLLVKVAEFSSSPPDSQRKVTNHRKKRTASYSQLDAGQALPHFNVKEAE